MIDYKLTEAQNRWWRNPQWMHEDVKLQEFDRATYKFIPTDVLSLPEEKQAVHVITGPRQTGKSTALKLKIKQLLESGISPRSVFYYNCDALSSKKDVIDLVVEYLDTVPAQKHYVFLDEISSITDWPYGIKWLSDEGFFKTCVIYLSGSSGISLKKSGELLPGRRGRGRNVDFLPLSFFQVLKIKGYRVEKIAFNNRSILRHLKMLHVEHADRIRIEFIHFLQTGGFLRVINEFGNPLIHQIYQETLKSEIIKNGKSEKSMRMVIRKIIDSLSSETSYTNVAEEAELGSKNTAIDYLDFLIDSFFLHESLFFDIAQKKYILKKNKKYHFTDPYVLWLLWGYFTGNGVNFSDGEIVMNPDMFIFESNSGPVVENYIASELVKAHKRFYYSHTVRELDFYLPDEALGIEVKYKQTITSQDMKSLEQVRNTLLISKHTLERRGDLLIVPAHLSAMIELDP